jgi:anaerobic C4-dicarboxylate transporter-like protein
MLTIQLLIVISVLVIGIRIGGIGIGSTSTLGVLLLVFFFGNAPASPPYEVIFIVLSIVTACGTLQSAGGIELLVSIAEKIIRKRPDQIAFVAPLVTYLFTFFAGTGYVAYSLLPVIAEVSIQARVRPERPLSISVIASQLAITASPVSAATATLIGLLSANNSIYGLYDILIVCLPATIGGTIAGALATYTYPRNANFDSLELLVHKQPDPSHKNSAWLALAIFTSAMVLIVVLGISPGLRPFATLNGKLAPLAMGQLIPMLMFSTTTMILVICRCDSRAIIEGSIMQSGIIAIVSITGVTWMGNCFFESNKDLLTASLSNAVKFYPWAFCIGLFVLSAIVYSQAASVAALMPLGFVLGIADPFLIAVFPAVNGFFVFPTSGTLIAAVTFDRTGSTRIGNWVFNHSFMLPGLVAVTVSVLIASLTVFLLY